MLLDLKKGDWWMFLKFSGVVEVGAAGRRGRRCAGGLFSGLVIGGVGTAYVGT